MGRFALKTLDAVENVVMIGCFVAALGLGFYQVVLRYVFSSGYQWMEGWIVLLTVWAALFGGSRAIRDRIHARVGILADALPRRPRQALNLVVVTICIVFCVMMLIFGLQYVQFMHGVGSRSLRVQIPTWQVFLIVPTFLGVYTLRYLIEFVRIARDPSATLTAGMAEEVSEEFVEEQVEARDALLAEEGAGSLDEVEGADGTTDAAPGTGTDRARRDADRNGGER